MSVVALLLCFLIGYAAFQTAFLVESWIAGSFSDCKSDRDPNCNENAEKPAVEFDGR